MTLTCARTMWCLPLLALPATAVTQCPPQWLPGEPAAITAGDFRAATLFDPDGPGPATADLIVGGTFEGLGGGSPGARTLARWDGARWYPYIFFSPPGGTVLALTTFDFDADGPNPAQLVAAGTFTLGFGTGVVNNILATSGQGFTRLSDGFNGSVNALLVFDADADGPNPPQLFAAGAFSRSGTRTIGLVARWDGSQWQTVGSNLTGTANTLAIVDLDGPGPNPPALVAGGRLSAASQTANVAVFDGTAWSRLGSLDNEVYALSTFDFDAGGSNPPRLVAAGIFRNTTLNGQAYYNGSSWQPIAPVPSFPTTTGRAIISYDPDNEGPLPARLLFAGSIPVAGQGQPARLVELVNNAWVPIAGPSFAGDIFSLTPIVLPRASQPVVLTGGTLVGPLPERFSYRLATLDADSFQPFGPGFSAAVQIIEPTTITGVPGLLVIGGAPYIPGVAAAGISHFDGLTWTPLGTPSPSSAITAAISYDPDGNGPAGEQIVLAGYIESINSIPMQNVAVYNGTSWSPLGATGSLFTDLTLFDPDDDGPLPPILLAAGGIVPGGPGTPNFIYQWTGSQWAQFGPAFTSANGPAQVSFLTTFDPDAAGPARRQLVVVGAFNRAGAVLASNAVAFDGSTWTALGSGFSTNPQSAFTWDPAHNGHEVVVVSGGFTLAGGVPARGAAVWNGSTWSALGAGFGVSQSGFQNYPIDFDVFQGDLYAAGNFSVSTGGPGNAIACWDGAAWQSLGSGLDPAGAYTLGALPASDTHPETLAVGGVFQSAGGNPSAFFARYASVPCCPADFNADGVVASDDFFSFLVAFLNSDPAADINLDGAVTSTDFFDFVRSYFVGC